MRFEDFVLQIDASSRGGFRARVLKSPFGEGTVAFSLPSLSGAEMARQASGKSRHLCLDDSMEEVDVRPPLGIGTELYRSVFQSHVRTLLDKSLGQLERSTNLGLRLKIKLDPGDEEAGALADLPWELLCDETEDFLALSRQTSVVRYLDVPRSSQPIPFTPPLRILAVGASPRGMEPLDLEEEMQRLDELNRSSTGVSVKLLPHASAGAVRELLSREPYNILHFMGHGTFEPTSGEGMLAFEAADGSLDLVSGKAFATKLRDSRSMGVVVLNACDTARARNKGGGNPFRGVATALVLGGVPAVVAMRQPISDRAAIGFSNAFYRHLAHGESIDEALTEGRQAIHSAMPEAYEWATPVLFLRIPEGHVFEAREAAQPEPKEIPAQTAAPVPPPPPPVQSQVEPSRRGMMLKVGSAAAGAALVGFVLYTKALAPSSSPVQPAETPPIADPTPSKEDSKHQTSKTAARLDTGKPRSGESRSGLTLPGPSAPHGSSPAPVQPAVKPVQPGDGAETAAPSADLSSLSAQVLSVVRREEGGLRVTVSFKNAGALPLSAVIDAESSVLSDNQGQRYEILDSDLPSSGANPRLQLAGGATSRHTFDFGAPKLGSNKFYVAFATQDGHRLKVSGSPVTLE